MNRFALIGERLGHSLSAKIHEQLFDMLKVPGSYDLLEIPPEQVSQVGQSLAKQGYSGFNVTIPYKQRVMEQLAGVSEEAEKIGAVNTVQIQDGRLFGCNTDYYGFGRMLEQLGFDPRGKKAVLLGMGGAHRAAAAYLLDHGVNELVSVSRKENNPPAFPGSCERVAGYDVLEREGGALLVNATPVGMYPRARVSPVGPEVVSRFDCVADLIYNPLTTRLMEYARQQGKGCCNGLFMLVAQAVKAQEIWLGRTIGQQAEENIYHSLLKTLKEETGHGA